MSADPRFTLRLISEPWPLAAYALVTQASPSRVNPGPAFTEPSAELDVTRTAVPSGTHIASEPALTLAEPLNGEAGNEMSALPALTDMERSATVD